MIRILVIIFVFILGLESFAYKCSNHVYAIDISTGNLSRRNTEYAQLLGEAIEANFKPVGQAKYGQKRLAVIVETDGSISEVSPVSALNTTEDFESSVISAIDQMQTTPLDRRRKFELVFENRPLEDYEDELEMALESL